LTFIENLLALDGLKDSHNGWIKIWGAGQSDQRRNAAAVEKMELYLAKLRNGNQFWQMTTMRQDLYERNRFVSFPPRRTSCCFILLTSSFSPDNLPAHLRYHLHQGDFQ
jgi:hypothetical protein